MKKWLVGVVALVASLGLLTGCGKGGDKGGTAAAPAPAAEKKAEAAAPAAPMFWASWEKGKAKGLVPPCGTNVLPLGGDDILQATVDAYCAVKPGQYDSYINPAAMEVYKARGTKYPDGKTGVLEFKEIGVAFTTEHKDGKPIYDVVSLKDGKSAASSEKGHPLNPETCAACHAAFNGACVGFVCGNRN